MRAVYFIRQYTFITLILTDTYEVLEMSFYLNLKMRLAFPEHTHGRQEGTLPLRDSTT